MRTQVIGSPENLPLIWPRKVQVGGCTVLLASGCVVTSRGANRVLEHAKAAVPAVNLEAGFKARATTIDAQEAALRTHANGRAHGMRQRIGHSYRRRRFLISER